ncbi:hypothetical protein TNCV_3525791 [Trichonephila clavipes]|nr:hypothetical protein TNCV_3525791 [Trichonephila clavipes]
MPHLIWTAANPGPRNLSSQGARCTFVVICSLEHHTSDSMILLGSSQILRENTLEGVSGLPPLFPFYQPHERACSSTLFRVPPCRKGIIHLQTSMSSTGFELKPYGIAVIVANHCVGWAT